MLELLNASNIFFVLLGYQVSYLEFFGTVTYFASVILIARKNILTWPIGIVSVILFMLLFYQFQLYSDTLEQVYYLVVGLLGWALWNRRARTQSLASHFSEIRFIVSTAIATIAVGLALGLFMRDVHLFLPTIFPLPASAPFLDALTTVMSFVAMWLLVIRRTESWLYWILVDLAAIYLYFSKGLVFLGVQYVLLLAIATYGFIAWLRDKSEHSAHLTV